MRKFLSMVLALAMAMSLVTFTAAPASAFTDSASISNQTMQQAADVINAIAVMDGYSDGSFQPQNELTRQAAAKIICNLVLGPTTAKALPTTVAPFPDVAPGTEWAGYISYCAERNIISGYADGTFKPTGSLSGYAFLKMLLGALGYDQKIEGYVGSNWRVNVAKQALGIGLDDGLGKELDGTATVKREEAALYAFNMLQSDLVEYESKTTVNLGSGNSIVIGNNTAKPQTWASSATSARRIGNDNEAGGVGAGALDLVQFAEQYFKDLRRDPLKNKNNPYGADDMGRPSVEWFWKGESIGKYTEVPVATYYGSPKINKIYTDIKMGSSADHVEFYVNGQEVITYDSDGDKTIVGGFERGNDKGLNDLFLEAGDNKFNAAGRNIGPLNDDDSVDGSTTAGVCDGKGLATVANNNAGSITVKQFLKERIGDGTITEVFKHDNDNSITICSMTVYGGKVSNVRGATTKKDAYVVIDPGVNHFDAANAPGTGDWPYAAPVNFNVGTHDEYETTAFVEDDVVAYTYSDSDESIQSMYKLQSVEGTLTQFLRGKSLQLGGNTYPYARTLSFKDMGNGQNDLSNSSEYVVYLDNQGNALWVEEAEFAVDNYALLTRINTEKTAGGINYTFDADFPAGNAGVGSWNGNRARLMFPNGTERNVDLDGTYLDDAATASGYALKDYVDISAAAGGYKIVRYSELSNGTYKLRAPKDGAVYRCTNFVLNNKTINVDMVNGVTAPGAGGWDVWYAANGFAAGAAAGFYATAARPQADSSTLFVINSGDSNKTYTGLRNAPNIDDGFGGEVTAYAYVRDNTIKMLYTTDSTTTNTSKDITFIIGSTASKLVDESDYDNFYYYNAVVKGQMTTVRVKAQNGAIPTVLTTDDHGMVAGWDKAADSVIVNQINTDDDDLIETATFNSATVTTHTAWGVKRNSATEVKVDTWNGGGRNMSLASDAKLYYIDEDSNLQVLASVNNIGSDTNDWVFYTLDDGEITNLFIVAVEDDAGDGDVVSSYGNDLGDLVGAPYNSILNDQRYADYNNPGNPNAWDRIAADANRI